MLASKSSAEITKAESIVEHSKLLWYEGKHRKAIQTLHGAIEAKVFREDKLSVSLGVSSFPHDSSKNTEANHNLSLARVS